MITAIIVDDKPANVFTLQKLLKEYIPDVTVTGTAGNVAEGILAIERLQPSIVFLDIEMPGGTGFDLLRHFKELTFEVIFVTAYDQYALKAFGENAIGYLLKPIEIDALQLAVSKAIKQIELKQTRQHLIRFLQQVPASLPDKISLPVLDGYLFINKDDIIRCEASGSYSWFYMNDGRKIMVSMHMRECEDLLPSREFYRVHHSHIVHLKYLVRYIKGRGGYAQMQDGSTVEVAVSRKADFLKLVQNHFRT